jgi:hypothetical protein
MGQVTWLWPLVVTLFAFGAASWLSRPDGPFYSTWGGFEIFIFPVIAAVVSAASWGLWAVLA